MDGRSRLTTVGLLLVALVVTSACAERRAVTGGGEPPREAWAELKNAQGESVGSAVLREEGGRVRLVVHARGLAPGRHGIHVHGTGRCDPPTFASAGDHL